MTEPQIPITECVVCHKPGRLNKFHKDGEEKYVVVHGNRDYTWGKSKLTARDRCYMKKIFHEEWARRLFRLFGDKP